MIQGTKGVVETAPPERKELAQALWTAGSRMPKTNLLVALVG